MKKFLSLAFILGCCLLHTGNLSAQQPYWGTIFVDSNIVRTNDPTLHVSTTYTGQGNRTVYDRRAANWVTINAYLYDVVWSDGLTAEAIVNPEFGSSAAGFVEADKYGRVLGQLPTALRQDCNELWIHKGMEAFGGGNNSVLIHTDYSTVYEADGILEETLIHELSHTSLDAAHAASSGWIAAQNADGNFISGYAAQNPTREDVAESFLMWLAVRQCNLRVTQQTVDTVNFYIPNRLAYFDNQNFDTNPICVSITGIDEMNAGAVSLYPNPFQRQLHLKRPGGFDRATITLFDNCGKAVMLATNMSGNEVVLSRGDLPAGFYVVQVRVGDEAVVSHKVLIID